MFKLLRCCLETRVIEWMRISMMNARILDCARDLKHAYRENVNPGQLKTFLTNSYFFDIEIYTRLRTLINVKLLF
jgi:hypothetical protein